MQETEPTPSDLAAEPWSETPFEADGPADGGLLVEVDGFEGPLDLLLALARTHKVDLARISILALADQYLGFIAEARRLRLEVAAEYLVMAAWLAYLKSRLLLPREESPTDELSGDELAARLHFRLQRLAAMRDAAAKLMTRHRLGIDVFPRGMPEGVRTIRETAYTAAIYDLLSAYSRQRQRTVKRVVTIKKRRVWSIKEARVRLEAMVGEMGDWTQLDMFLEQYLLEPEEIRTVKASSFGATLEMAREGLVELRQERPFAPIYMRRRGAGEDWELIA
ncbi:MAG: segregation/condensation protein A [Hyphomicrobiaceae bacterium]|nr:segregation/condensation protein A [Hyphomicrobiaceae bacterium]